MTEEERLESGTPPDHKCLVWAAPKSTVHTHWPLLCKIAGNAPYLKIKIILDRNDLSAPPYEIRDISAYLFGPTFKVPKMNADTKEKLKLPPNK